MRPVVFFDLFGVIVERTAAALRLRRDARALLEAASSRVGLLAFGDGSSRGELLRQLSVLGLQGAFEEALLLDPSAVPFPPSDPRVFKMAAVLADVPVEQCVFVSLDPVLLVAAAAAGMKAVSLPSPSEERPSASVAALASAAPRAAKPLSPGGTAAQRPTYVLEGRVVTMNARSDVIDKGRILVRGEEIVAVEPITNELPEEFRNAPRIDTHGTLYPGLIDLHNHFVYNVLPLWPVPKKYNNRTQWPRHPDYGPQVSLPVKLLAQYSISAKAVVRYVEAKALLGGTTTGQGILTQVKGGRSLFRGAMRNVEAPDDARFPVDSSHVPDLAKGAEAIAAFRRGLETYGAYFYHLGEGVDDYARDRYFDLADNALIQPSLVGIHCLGLKREDLSKLAELGAKVVWSPFSNLLLYGQTVTIADLLASGVEFSLGCDWSPTGSKNLLEELKVARHEARRQGASLSSEALVRAVTTQAAKVAGWHQQLGMLRTGFLADLLVVAGTTGDPYDLLISATEKQVRLVLVNGVARYGDRTLMERLSFFPEPRLEPWKVDSIEKAFCLWTDGSALNDLSFAQAESTLRDAMSDLPGFRRRMEENKDRLMAFGLELPEPFTLELDNEPEELAPPDGVLQATDFTKVASQVELDLPTVGGASYWDRLARQTNLDAQLKEDLKSGYP